MIIINNDLELLKKLIIILFLDLVYNESLNYLRYSYTNPMPGKNLVREI